MSDMYATDEAVFAMLLSTCVLTACEYVDVSNAV